MPNTKSNDVKTGTPLAQKRARWKNSTATGLCIAAAGFLATAQADAQTNRITDPTCGDLVYLTPAQMKEMSADEYHTYVMRSSEFGLCRWEETSREPSHYRPAGDSAFYQHLLRVLGENHELFKTRKPFLTYEQHTRLLGARFRDPKWRSIGTYALLGDQIASWDRCQPNCSKPYLLEQLESQGKNPKAEMARIANTRVDALPPWFTIGKVEISTDGTNNRRRSEMSIDQQTAERAYQNALETRNLRKRELDQAKDTHRQKVQELRKVPDDIAKRITQIESGGRPDPDAVRETRQWLELDGRIERLYDRREEIDKAIENLAVNYPASDQFAQRRIRALQQEHTELDATEESLTERRDALNAPQLTAAQRAELAELKDKLDLEKRHARRAIRYENERLDRAQQLFDGAQEDLDEAEEAKMAVRDRQADWRPTRTARVVKVRTEHADLDIADEGTGEVIESLNKRIRQLRRTQSRLKDQRKAARERVKELAAIADEKSTTLGRRGGYSVFLQAGLEIGFAAADLWESGTKGGAAGVLLKGIQTFTQNAIFPPSYYDADKGRLADYMSRSSRAGDYHYADVDTVSGLGKKFGKEFVKVVMKSPHSALAKRLNQQVTQNTFKALSESYLKSGGTNHSLIQSMIDNRKQLNEITKELADRTGKNGARELAKHGWEDFKKGLKKSFGKEVAKNLIAKLVEGRAFDDYMYAQVDLADAVFRMQHVGSLYWANEDELSMLRDLRDNFEERYRPGEGTLVNRNEPFFAEADYSVELIFEEGARASRINAKVSLGGIELTRAGSLAFWKIPASARFTKTMPAQLKLEIVFQ
ncbi:MAG: hypothetical protein ABJH63_10660 [Rhizobiaceae bacterium]